MDKDTPRQIIRGILRSSTTSSSARRTNKKSPRKSVSTSLKRPPQDNVRSTAKRLRSSFSTPSETATPRTTIKNLLVAANKETAVVVERHARKTGDESLEQEKSVHEAVVHLPHSSISNVQFERLVGSSSSLRNSSSNKPASAQRRTRRNQRISTPSETITPRATIRTFLSAADTETPIEMRAGHPPNEEADTEVQKENETILINKTSVGSKLENDKKEATFPQTDQSERNISEVDDGEDSGPGVSVQSNNEVPEFSNNEASYIVSDSSEPHGISASTSSVRWSNLQTPILPNESISRATPVVFSKPPIPQQHRNLARNLTNVLGKNKAETTNTKAKPKSCTERFAPGLVKGIFEHFSALGVSRDALEAIQAGSDNYFKNMSSDLFAYSNHAKRKTIEKSDVELLMHRQGLVSSKTSFYALVEKYLPLEYRKEIIPAATSGNKVVPKPK